MSVGSKSRQTMIWPHFYEYVFQDPLKYLYLVNKNEEKKIDFHQRRNQIADKCHIEILDMH